MTIKEILKKCNCKYAKAENGGGDSVTFYIVCKLKAITTDKEHCQSCNIREVEA